MAREAPQDLKVFRDSLALPACLDLLDLREEEVFPDPRGTKVTPDLLVDLESLGLQV